MSECVFYLHGFASSPASRKALFFCEKLGAEGIQVDVPRLDEGNFEQLTITGQLRAIERLVGDEPVVLIGSSMGGYLSALYAASHPAIERLLLLAPAFGYLKRWQAMLSPEELKKWKETGSRPIFHYGENRERQIGYQLLEDSAQYDPAPAFSQPALIFHGTQDDTVPVEYSADFVSKHPNARLIQMNSDHQLTNVLEEIWEQSKAFILHG